MEKGDLMLTKDEAKELILDLFEEEALIIGGLFAVHEVGDDLVWRLMKNLDVILGKALNRLGNQKAGESTKTEDRASVKPHPAIEEFLLKLRRI